MFAGGVASTTRPCHLSRLPLWSGSPRYPRGARDGGHPGRNLPRRHVGGEPTDLPGYRVRHALYKTDPDLPAAYRAYWEHLPLRRPPRGATMPLYRRLRFGDLVEVNLLDTRQYRDDQPCGEDGSGGGRVVTCPERVDPRRTILGDHQRRWLLRGLDRSRADWNVLTQQVVLAWLDLHPGP
jgi:alkaline phosphatase D